MKMMDRKVRTDKIKYCFTKCIINLQASLLKKKKICPSAWFRWFLQRDYPTSWRLGLSKVMKLVTPKWNQYHQMQSALQYQLLATNKREHIALMPLPLSVRFDHCGNWDALT